MKPLDITGPLAVGKSFNLFFRKKQKTPLVVGKDDNGVKILYLNSVQIVNESFINTKFPDYYKVMYNGNPKYGELWEMNLVYI